MLRIGDWCVDSAAGVIVRDGQKVRLEARTMRLLLCLAERAGKVVSIDELLSEVWAGVIVTPDSVYQAVASLRRLLGDDPRNPTYIATVPRLGYQMVAAVGPVKRARRRWIAIVIAVVLAGGIAFFYRGNVLPAAAPQLQKSVAVLPFLDLTEGMKEEEFADGVSEELVGKLIRVPGLRVFYLKNKKRSADIAKTLRVRYVLDGSIRKSGKRLRVAARLIRADSGDIVWSERYDRPWGDILTVQDDIAGNVTNALAPTIQ